MKKWGACAVAIAGLLALAAGGHANAAVKTKVTDYKIGDGTFEGFWAYDDAQKGKRPGVVIIPAYTGLSDNEREHAERLAKLGYVAFVADVYGKGIRPAVGKAAGMEAAKYRDNRPLYRARVLAGFDQLKASPMVDPNRMAAMGYCFGGLGAMELGRTGAPLKAIVLFHSELSNPTPADDKNIKAHVLALQGADDPIVPVAAREAFEKEMRDAGIDWEMVAYSHTVHAYTAKDSGNDPSKGAAYNPESEKRSWIAMKDFFSEYLR